MTQTPNQVQDPGAASRREDAGAARGAGPIRRAAWRLEEGFLWKAGDLLRSLGQRVLWPLESATWAVRSRLAWPAQDRLRTPAARGAAAGALAVVAAIGVAYVAGSDPDNGSSDAPDPAVAASQPTVASVVPPRTIDSAADTEVLRGAAPTFEPESDAAKAGKNPAAADSAAQSGATDATASGDGSDPKSDVGPAPLKVAHRFADAFVSYEIGEGDGSTGKVFRATATRPLAKSLARRPPRQPAEVKVPKARVLNIVPGRRLGSTVAVSVSLLRVGATSELRLQLQQVKRKWLVSDVRG